jgi:hypothetical protein
MASDLQLIASGEGTGDMQITLGDFAIVSDGAEVAQAVKIRLRLVLGEWFLDTRLGTDYPGVVWVKGPDLMAVEGLLRRTILETPGMATLTAYSQTFTTSTRSLVVTFAGTTEDGTAIADAEVIGL